MGTSSYQQERITVVAKTYPEDSRKYGGLVCTAGINDKGEWRRLYPIPWALFWSENAHSRAKKFQTFDIISLPIRRRTEDSRHESYSLNPHTVENDLQIVGHVKGWEKQRDFFMPYLDSDIETLRSSQRSLGLIKPSVIQDFLQKDRSRLEPDEDLTLAKLEAAQQLLLLDVESELVMQSRTTPELLPWIGYKFLCQGSQCQGHEMMCIDWGIQQLFRRYQYDGTEGFQQVKYKALDWMVDRDMYFIVGTTWRFKTWLIIGVFYPPKQSKHKEQVGENLRLF